MSDEPPQQNIAPIASAETVNVSTEGPPASIHAAVITIIGVFTICVMIGFGLISWAVLRGETGLDAATKGSIIQTWNNLAVGAAAVWTGTKLVDALARKHA